MNRSLCNGLILILFCVNSWGADSSANPFLKNFDDIWKSIQSTFPCNEEQKDAWTRIFESFRKEASTLTSSQDLTKLSNRMFSEMGISHMRIIPASVPIDSNSSQAIKNLGYPGFRIHWNNNTWLIEGLNPDDGFLQNGFELTAINDIPTPADSTIYPKEILLGVRKRLLGSVGDQMKLTYRDHDGVEGTHSLSLIPWAGVRSKSFGNFPSIPVIFETEIKRDVTIIRFSNFVMDIHQQILKAVDDAKKNKGLVFDLRGNTGGVGMMANGITGRLSDKAFNMGTMKLKKGEINFHVYPQQNPYLGKIAVLVDQFSASTSEIFAQGLKEAGRAEIFGCTTMGAALPSKFVRLNNGLIFQQAIATLTSAEGKNIEGNGVTPHHFVYKTKDDLIRGTDPVLSSALDWILSDSVHTTLTNTHNEK